MEPVEKKSVENEEYANDPRVVECTSVVKGRRVPSREPIGEKYLPGRLYDTLCLAFFRSPRWEQVVDAGPLKRVQREVSWTSFAIPSADLTWRVMSLKTGYRVMDNRSEWSLFGKLGPWWEAVDSCEAKFLGNFLENFGEFNSVSILGEFRRGCIWGSFYFLLNLLI